jgi:hypothetical protein
MFINVTKEDIEDGRQGDGFYCPVALAIKRTTGINIGVGTSLITIKNRTIKLPKMVQSKIYLFDKKGTIRPFKFNLKISQKWIDKYKNE